MTPRQQQILQAIYDYRAIHFVSPTLRELAVLMGVNQVTMLEHMRTLVKHGAVEIGGLTPTGKCQSRDYNIAPAHLAAMQPKIEIPFEGSVR